MVAKWCGAPAAGEPTTSWRRMHANSITAKRPRTRPGAATVVRFDSGIVDHATRGLAASAWTERRARPELPVRADSALVYAKQQDHQQTARFHSTRVRSRTKRIASDLRVRKSRTCRPTRPDPTGHRTRARSVGRLREAIASLKPPCGALKASRPACCSRGVARHRRDGRGAGARRARDPARPRLRGCQIPADAGAGRTAEDALNVVWYTPVLSRFRAPGQTASAIWPSLFSSPAERDPGLPALGSASWMHVWPTNFTTTAFTRFS